MKIRYRTLFTILFGISSQGTAIASATAFVSLDAVALFSEPAYTQALNLFNNLGNTYVAKHQWQSVGSGMVGLGLRTYHQHTLDVNTSVRYLPVSTITSQGDVLQLHSPAFRNLSYRYNTTSNLVLLDNIISWTGHRVAPGLILGVGGVSNTTAHYQESPLTSHAATLDHFSGYTKTQFAYELGAVLDYTYKSMIIECAYRYLDAGRGQLGLSSIQNTTEHLSTGPLHYHAISLGVRFYHAI